MPNPNLLNLVTQASSLNQQPFYPAIHGHAFSSPQISSKHPVAILPPISKKNAGRKTLVLDLDETLVHSSFDKIRNPDIVIPDRKSVV